MAPVLVVAALAEAASILHFYPGAELETAILLLLVSAASLLVLGVSWIHLSSLPPVSKAGIRRRTAGKRRRGRARVRLVERLLGWLYSLGSGATTFVVLIFFISLFLVVLAASEAALSVYREVYLLTPGYIQPHLSRAYGLVKPLMVLRPVEKCLLAQNLPPISVAAGSLIVSRQRG